MATAFLWGVAVLVAAFLALVLTPVTLRLRAESAPTPRLRIGASPFGGTVPAIPVYDSARRKPKPRKEAARKHWRLRQPGRREAERRRAMGVARAAGHLVRDILASVSLDWLRLSADYGTGDPAETGQLCGWLAPLVWGTPDREAVAVDLRPDFERAVLAGEIDAAVRFIPVALVPPAARFAWVVWGPGR